MSNAFSITIDGRVVEVQPGESVLAVSRKLGLDIPTLCYLEKCGPLNSCQVCLVKINGKLVPLTKQRLTPDQRVLVALFGLAVLIHVVMKVFGPNG